MSTGCAVAPVPGLRAPVAVVAGAERSRRRRFSGVKRSGKVTIRNSSVRQPWYCDRQPRRAGAGPRTGPCGAPSIAALSIALGGGTAGRRACGLSSLVTVRDPSDAGVCRRVASSSSGAKLPRRSSESARRARGGKPVRPRAEQGPGLAQHIVTADRRERRPARRRGSPAAASSRRRAAELPAQPAEQRAAGRRARASRRPRAARATRRTHAAAPAAACSRGSAARPPAGTKAFA